MGFTQVSENERMWKVNFCLHYRLTNCINMLYFLPYEYHILVFMLQLARQHLLITATFNTAYRTA